MASIAVSAAANYGSTRILGVHARPEEGKRYVRVERNPMPRTKRILVESSAGSYSVVCGAGALSRLSRELQRSGDFSSVHAVTLPGVWSAVGKHVMRGLRGINAHVHKFNDAEAAKNVKTVEAIARSLVKAGADRRAVVIAVCGGVVRHVPRFAPARHSRVTAPKPRA